MGTALPRIFLTGGSGFIGSRLAIMAIEAGYPVTVSTAINTDSERARCEILRAHGIQIVAATLEDAAVLAAALPGHDVIIHLAAAQHEAGAPESHFHRVNVEGTRNLLNLAVQAGVKRFVHGSTIGVYGSASDGLLSETSPLAPDNSYGRTKAEAEDVVRSFANQIEIVIIRISETYGPSDMRLLKLYRAIKRGQFITLGTGTNEHQLIHVEDLARGLLLAAQAPAAVGETIVLAGSERLTTSDIVETISRSLGRRKRLRHVPLWPFDLAARVLEKICAPLGMKPPLHRRRLDFFRKSFRFSTDKAERLLAFRATIPFIEGARMTAEWYQKTGQI